ncbi:hypothetical protein [Streptomyces yangpuensis]|uniref:hypothetical protein n=1 Tax=Streptomyces yangpuensis TaxID=1648182 RepID=UPI000AE72FB4|nr:hypothetical protein [Streptomyces yangpuensis]
MMLRYALQTVRHRNAGFLGAFVALLCATALITACGTLLPGRVALRVAPAEVATAKG